MSVIPPKAGIAYPQIGHLVSDLNVQSAVVQENGAVQTQPRHVNDSKQRAIAQFRRALMATMSATRWLPARCHLTCTMVPTLTSHHEPCASPTKNRVLSVTWYVQGRRLRVAVKLRAASSRAVTVPPPLGDPKYAGTANADERRA